MRGKFRIVLFGFAKPSALSSFEDVIFCEQSYRGVRKFLLEQSDILKTVTVVHGFDTYAGMLGSFIAATLRVPLVVTKPGGPPVNRWYPVFRNMVVVQAADVVHLSGLPVRPPNRILLSSNRISPLRSASNRVDPFSKVPDGVVKILRIARFCKEHIGSIYQTIELGRRLTAQGIPNSVCIVGEPSAREFVDLIREKCIGCAVEIFTQSEFSRDAFELVTFCDVVVGAGRTAMEAMSLGKPLFIPSVLNDLPIFLNYKRYDSAYRNNFTSRNLETSEKNIAEDGLVQFIEMLNSAAMLCEYSNFMKEKFKLDCDAAVGAASHEEFYRTLKRERWIDMALFQFQRTVAHVLRRARVIGTV